MPSTTSLALFSSQPPPSTTSNLFTLPEHIKEQDVVPPPPPPPQPCIVVRKSCEFSHHSPACIKKATHNLNKLEKSLEERCNYDDDDDVIVNVFTKRVRSREHPSKLENIQSGRSLQINGEMCNVMVSTSDDAVACNVRVSTSDDVVMGSKENVCQIPKTCMQKVEGVRNLIQRMECDRLSTVDLFTRECERTVKLQELIDVAAYKRVHKLPAKVQEEHDKCIFDIHELKWHYEYQGRIENRLFEDANQVENMNKKLVHNVNLIQENEPLMEEKLRLEDEAIKTIQAKQNRTDAALKAATEEMNRIKDGFEGLKVKAEEEQGVMMHQASSLTGTLNANLHAIFVAQSDHMEMEQGIVDTKNKILEEETKIKSEGKHLENLVEIGAFLKEKVEECKRSIVEQKNLCKSYMDDIESIRLQQGEQTTRLDEMRKRLEKQLAHNTKELRKIIMLNKKTKKEIQTFKKRIENCERNRISNEKAAKRAVTELETIQDDLLLIKEQALDLKHLHVTLQMKLDQEYLKSREGEEKLSEQSAGLLKENKDESHARKILLARIKAESASFEHKKNESELKKQKILKTDKDLRSVIENIEQQIIRLSAKYEERRKTMEGLDRLLVQVNEKSSRFYEATDKDLVFLQTSENTLKLNVSEVKSKQEHMGTTTENLNKKSQDMTASAIMMSKFLSSNESAIEELQEELAELEMQLDTANVLDEKLRKNLAEIETRSSSQKEKHCNLITKRRRTLDNISKLLAESLEENDMLATKYINLQYKHMNEKNQFVNTYEKNLIAEESLRDKESLCELHTRLHEALKCYYQLRGIQTKAGLSRFEDMTQTSYSRLRYIQGELERCVFNVCAFLKASKRSQKLQARNIAFSTQEPAYVS